MTTSTPERKIAVLGALLLALIIAPLALNPFLPFEDLPNHIARRYLSATQGGALDGYFTFREGVMTNAAVDLAWRLLGPMAGDVVTFSRLAAGFAMVGFVLSVVVLHRVLHGHWSAWPLLAVLLVYNANLLWGFENFVVTAPFGILGFALWVATRDRGLVLRLSVTTAVVAVLYLGHVLVLLAYATLVFGYDAGRAWRQRHFEPRNVSWVGLTVVAAACVAYLLLTGSEPAPGYGTETRFGTLDERLQLLLAPFGSVWSGTSLQVLARQGPILVAGLLLLLVVGLQRGLSVAVAPGMRTPVLMLGLATFLMPAQLSGVYFAHLRYPFILLGVIIAATDPRGAAPWLRGAMAMMLIAAVATRAFVLDRSAQAYSAQIAELVSLAGSLPAGSRVLPVVALKLSRETTLHFHTAAYLVPFAEAFVPTLFVGGSHELGIAPQWQELSAPQPSAVPAALLAISGDEWTEPMDQAWGFAHDWAARFTHILVIGEMTAEAEAALPARRIANAGIMALLAIRADDLPADTLP